MIQNEDIYKLDLNLMNSSKVNKQKKKTPFWMSEIQNVACSCRMTQNKDVYKFNQNMMNSLKVISKTLYFLTSNIQNFAYRCRMIQNEDIYKPD